MKEQLIKRRVKEPTGGFPDSLKPKSDQILEYVSRTRFAKLSGVSVNYVVKLSGEDGTYVHTFIDGETLTVRSKRNKQGFLEYNQEDAIELRQKRKQKRKECIILPDIAKKVKLSPTPVRNFFGENGALVITVDGQEHTIILKQGAERLSGGDYPGYITAEELRLFKRWIETTYTGERTWTHRRKRKIPKGYVTVPVARKMLGYKENRAVTSRLRDGILEGKCLSTGWTVISVKSIEKLKEKMKEERDLPPEGAVCAKELYKLKLVTEYEIQKASIDEEENGKIIKYFRIRDIGVEHKKFRVYIGLDNKYWFSKEDFEIIKEILIRRKEEYLKVAAASRLLGLTIKTLKRMRNRIERTVTYQLPDGSNATIRFICPKNEVIYNRLDILEARRKRDEILKRMRTTPQIAEALGTTPAGFKKTYYLNPEGFIFEMNGKEYKIQVKKGHMKKGKKSSPVLYVWEEELEVLVRYRGIIDQQTHQGFCKHLIRNMGLQNKRFEELKVEGKGVIVGNVDGYTLTVELDQVNEKLYLDKKYTDIIRFYLDIHSERHSVRKRVVEELASALVSEDECTLKLLMLKSALNEEKEESVKEHIQNLLSRKEAQEIMGREISNPQLRPREPKEVSLDIALKDRPDVLEVLKKRGTPHITVSRYYKLGIPVVPNGNGGAVAGRDIKLLDLMMVLDNSDNGGGITKANTVLDRLLMKDLSEWTEGDFIELLIIREYALSRLNMDNGPGGELYSRLGSGNLQKAYTKYMERPSSESRYRILRSGEENVEPEIDEPQAEGIMY